MKQRSDYDEAVSSIEAARNAAEAARRAIALIPGAPSAYWAGLSAEVGPLAAAWYSVARAVDELTAAERYVTTASRSRVNKEVQR